MNGQAMPATHTRLSTPGKVAVAAAAAAVGLLSLAPSVSAQRGGGRNVTSFVVADGVYGGTTTATVSNPPAGTWVVSTCYQAGSPVIFNRLELDGSGQAVLTLGPTDGYAPGVGGADCEAEAKYWNLKRQRWVSLATTTFHVSD